MRIPFLLLFIFVLQCSAMAQSVISLYPDSIPNSIPSADEETSKMEGGVLAVGKISRPTLTLFLPSKTKATGAAVVICPGGGYWINAVNIEGTEVAQKMVEKGIAAIVLKYRIPDSTYCRDPSIAPLQDAQQAIITVRQKAGMWNIDPKRIGIMGFSAGGHLASTAATHFRDVVVNNPQGVSCRPDFVILGYPVISSDMTIAHKGSFEKLLGKNPTEERLNYFSNELQVTAETPPAFLVHASDDAAVNALNSVVFYQALLRNHVPAELHLYQHGGHGFGLHIHGTKEQWLDRCFNWMDANGWLKTVK